MISLAYRSLYCLRHTYATFRLVAGTDIHQLATQMGTSVKMLETFYSKVSPQMNAAIHSGRLETMWREEQEYEWIISRAQIIGVDHS